MAREQKNGAVVTRVNRSDVLHARAHFGVRKTAQNFHIMAEKAGDYFVIALDTEGIDPPKSDIPAMLQLSASVRSESHTAVFQLRSDKPVNPSAPVHVFQEGPPSELAEIFRIPGAVFLGKDVAKDIRRFASAIGLFEEEIQNLLVVETSRAFGFCHALSKGRKLSREMVGHRD